MSTVKFIIQKSAAGRAAIPVRLSLPVTFGTDPRCDVVCVSSMGGEFLWRLDVVKGKPVLFDLRDARLPLSLENLARIGVTNVKCETSQPHAFKHGLLVGVAPKPQNPMMLVNARVTND